MGQEPRETKESIPREDKFRCEIISKGRKRRKRTGSTVKILQSVFFRSPVGSKAQRVPEVIIYLGHEVDVKLRRS